MLTPTRRLDLSGSEESDCGRIKESSWRDNNADRGKWYGREASAVERLISEADFKSSEQYDQRGGLDKADRSKSDEVPTETALLSTYLLLLVHVKQGRQTSNLIQTQEKGDHKHVLPSFPQSSQEYKFIYFMFCRILWYSHPFHSPLMKERNP